eukprot:93719-Hanusia_phi.AAC.5
MDLAFFVALLRKMKLKVRPDGKFFDVGCGRGQLVLTAAKMGVRRLCASSSRAHAVARSSSAGVRG